jgi:hypothetical protein
MMASIFASVGEGAGPAVLGRVAAVSETRKRTSSKPSPSSRSTLTTMYSRPSFTTTEPPLLALIVGCRVSGRLKLFLDRAERKADDASTSPRSPAFPKLEAMKTVPELFQSTDKS